MDFVKFAEACHAYGERVTKPEDIRAALKNAFNSGKPAVIDFRIDPDELHRGLSDRMRSGFEKWPYLKTKKMPKTKYPIKVM